MCAKRNQRTQNVSYISGFITSCYKSFSSLHLLKVIVVFFFAKTCLLIFFREFLMTFKIGQGHGKECSIFFLSKRPQIHYIFSNIYHIPGQCWGQRHEAHGAEARGRDRRPPSQAEVILGLGGGGGQVGGQGHGAHVRLFDSAGRATGQRLTLRLAPTDSRLSSTDNLK